MHKDYSPNLYCINCGEITKDNVCTGCHRTYKLLNDIPCFIPDDIANSHLKKRYYSNYSIIAKDDIEKDMMPLFYKRAQAKKIINYIGNVKNKNILDIGAGKGLLLGMIDNENNKVAVDIAMDYLVLLKMNGFYTIMADAESLPFKNEFDLIIMVDILEHVLDTEKALHCVRRALREAGIVIIRVPFKEDISKYAIAAGCKYEFVHLRSFDKEDIISLLNKCGLNPIQFHYDGYTLDKARLLIRLPISFILNSFTIIKQLFKCKNNSVKDLKAIKDQMSEQINRIVSTLPNWLANIFFHPIELVVIASSNHVRKQQVYGLTSPRVINELHKRGTNYLREKHLITLRYVL